MELVDALKPGDRIITTAGIFGTVMGVQPDRIEVKIAANVKIDITKSAVGVILRRNRQAREGRVTARTRGPSPAGPALRDEVSPRKRDPMKKGLRWKIILTLAVIGRVRSSWSSRSTKRSSSAWTSRAASTWSSRS